MVKKLNKSTQDKGSNKNFLLVVSSIFVVGVLAGLLFANIDKFKTKYVSGQAYYRERIALPPQSVLHIELQDVSKMGAAATVISKDEIEIKGSVPVMFKLPYKTSEIDDRFTYSIRAKIVDSQGNTLFTTDTVNPVITRNAPTENVNVLLRRSFKNNSAQDTNRPRNLSYRFPVKGQYTCDDVNLTVIKYFTPSQVIVELNDEKYTLPFGKEKMGYEIYADSTALLQKSSGEVIFKTGEKTYRCALQSEEVLNPRKHLNQEQSQFSKDMSDALQPLTDEFQKLEQPIEALKTEINNKVEEVLDPIKKEVANLAEPLSALTGDFERIFNSTFDNAKKSIQEGIVKAASEFAQPMSEGVSQMTEILNEKVVYRYGLTTMKCDENKSFSLGFEEAENERFDIFYNGEKIEIPLPVGTKISKDDEPFSFSDGNGNTISYVNDGSEDGEFIFLKLASGEVFNNCIPTK